MMADKNPVAQSKVVPETQPKGDSQSVAYEITYSGSREILLNKTFQLAKPDFDSENDLVFSYLYEHPNQKFTRGQLEEVIGRKFTKSLHKIVENLGFEGELLWMNMTNFIKSSGIK